MCRYSVQGRSLLVFNSRMFCIVRSCYFHELFKRNVVIRAALVNDASMWILVEE